MSAAGDVKILIDFYLHKCLHRINMSKETVEGFSHKSHMFSHVSTAEIARARLTMHVLDQERWLNKSSTKNDNMKSTKLQWANINIIFHAPNRWEGLRTKKLFIRSFRIWSTWTRALTSSFRLVWWWNTTKCRATVLINQTHICQLVDYVLSIVFLFVSWGCPPHILILYYYV